MGDTIHEACGAIVDLHVNTHWTMRSQTGGQQFRRHLLSSLQGRAPAPVTPLTRQPLTLVSRSMSGARRPGRR